MTWKQKSKLQKCARKNYFRNLLRKRWTRRISRHMQPGLYHVHKERQLRISQDLASVAWMPVLPQSSSNSRCCSMAIFVSCGAFILDLVYWSWSNFLNTHEFFRAIVSFDCCEMWTTECAHALINCWFVCVDRPFNIELGQWNADELIPCLLDCMNFLIPYLIICMNLWVVFAFVCICVIHNVFIFAELCINNCDNSCKLLSFSWHLF